jgi:hypothetical protein
MKEREVNFRKNGFEVDDQDFPSNTHRANQAFFAAIPEQLRRLGIEMDDKHEEEFRPRPNPRDLWSGAGRNLSEAGPSAPARPPVAQAPEAAVAVRKTDFAVEGKPSTEVQLRFPNSAKLALTVSLDATVGDLRQYAREAEPDLTGRRFELQFGCPPKALTNDSETIEAAGLKKAQIIVTLG